MHPFNAEMTTKLYTVRDLLSILSYFAFRYDRRQKSACDYLSGLLFMGIFYQLCRPVSYFMSMNTF